MHTVTLGSNNKGLRRTKEKEETSKNLKGKVMIVKTANLCMFVCVCVCEREREREWVSVYVSVCVCVCVCERESV